MYSVVGADGQVYGPVDLGTLQQWCAEGRILPYSSLIDPMTGKVFQAQSLTALQSHFPGAQPQPNPQTPYYRGGSQFTGSPGAFSGSPYGQSPNLGPTPFNRPPQPYPGGMIGGKNRAVAAVLAFFLGNLGIHRFYLGYNNVGAIQLVLTLVGVFGGAVCCFPIVLAAAVGIWAFVDFIMILTGALKDANGYDLT